MTAERLMIDPGEPEPVFHRCREVLSAGGVIVYPTDTFYALGVDPANAAAVERLFQIKDRQRDQPILLLIGDSADVGAWASDVPSEALRLMDRYWPGPLTLVFRARPDVPVLLTGGKDTIGLRVPGDEMTRRLIAYVGHALTGTSANVSGMEAPRTADEAAAALGGNVDLILDGGPTAGGMPSTIAEVTKDRTVVIRTGAVRL